MVKFKKFKLNLFIFLFVFNKCALQLPPEGGHIDLTPPEVVSTFPVNGTINYSKNYFEIEFSEYIDKRSFKEALFISPAIVGKMIFKWTNKTVEVIAEKGFKENTTYVVTIGTDVIDLNNKNRMLNSYNLTFSTGDKIDEKIISGRIFDKQADGSLIYVYRFLTDTTNYLLQKPDYISQAGKTGEFFVKGLPDGKFRVFAVKDQFRDLLFQPDQDLIGFPYDDIALSAEDSILSNLNFHLSKIDTTPPRIIDIRMLDQNHLLVKFSDELDLSKLNQQNFKVIDTLNQKVTKISYLYNVVNKQDELILIPDNKLNSTGDLLLSAQDISDKYGNVLIDEKISFVTTEKSDTNKLKISKIEPADLKIDHTISKLRIYFDDAFIKDSIQKALNYYDINKNRIDFKINFLNDATIEINPIEKLKPDTKYQIELELRKLPDVTGNLVDTTIILNLTTMSDFDFSGLSGKIISNKNNIILVLESEINSELKYYHKANGDKAFGFNRILPGKFKLWAFEDRNKNNIYDYGSLRPFEFSEKFYMYPETIEIKPRWNLTDVIFKID